MIHLSRFLLICLACGTFFTSCSQSGDPFAAEIQAFKDQDKKAFPPKGAIVFVGSSSFTKWTDVQDYFPGYTIINRGFGGSQINDVVRHANDVIIPYQPKQVVIYCGDNDLPAGTPAAEVLKRFTVLFNTIRGKLPNANIVYVSIKPSPSRAKLMPVADEANAMIRHFLSTFPETGYVDVFHPMLNDAGLPKPEIFLSDSLHMNAKGYEIWKTAITPALKK